MNTCVVKKNSMIDNVMNWLQMHAWLCPYILAGCALITLLITFFKRKKRGSRDISMTIGNVNGGNINKANGNININDREKHAE